MCVWAPKQDMGSHLFRRLADFTDRVVDNAFLYQVCFAFDLLLRKQPREELDPWGCFVLPDQISPGIRSRVFTFESSLQHASVELFICFQHRAASLVSAVAELIAM